MSAFLRNKSEKIITLIFFIIFLLVGLLVFDDYGVSADEIIQREIGYRNYNYIFNGDTTLLNNFQMYYGPVFELFLIFIEKSFNLEDITVIYLVRHLVTFIFFYTSVVFFYVLCKKEFNNWKIALLGCLLLIVSPRIFADSFYNNKDIVFLSMFLIGSYTLVNFVNKPNMINAFLHALVSALTIDIRVVGSFLVFITLIFYLANLKKNKAYRHKRFTAFFVYIIFLSFFVILFWPAIWNSPIYGFINSLGIFGSNFQSFWRGEVLYFGQLFKGGQIPWHYSLVWIFITTPLFYTFCFIFGLFFAGKKFFDKKFKSFKDIFYIVWFFLPIVVIILFNSTIYGAWRHLFFVYPAFIVLSLKGFLFLYNKFNRQLISFFLILSLTTTSSFMILYHPFQNVYFNPIFSYNMTYVRQNFDLDYWGVSYIHALRYILENDNSSIIKVHFKYFGGQNLVLLSTDENSRIRHYANGSEIVDYVLDNFEWDPDGYGNETLPLYYSINITNDMILAVYKLKE